MSITSFNQHTPTLQPHETFITIYDLTVDLRFYLRLHYIITSMCYDSKVWIIKIKEMSCRSIAIALSMLLCSCLLHESCLPIATCCILLHVCLVLQQNRSLSGACSVPTDLSLTIKCTCANAILSAALPFSTNLDHLALAIHAGIL